MLYLKGGKTIVAAYNGNLSETLSHLFPEIEFNEKLFDMLPSTTLTFFPLLSFAFSNQLFLFLLVV